MAVLLRRHDRDRFLASWFAPAATRPALWALLAFNYEIARVRETVTQPILGQIRLQWWREVLDEHESGKPPRNHYIAIPLTDALSRYPIERAHLDRMIDARERDLDDTPPETLVELEAYAEATSSELLLAELEVLGVMAPAAKEAARHVGIAWALIGLIRALPFHRAAGRIYVPAELVDPAIVLAQPESASVRKALTAMAAVASGHLAAARALHRLLPKAALPVLLPARLASNYLARLRSSGFSGDAQPDQPLAALRLWFSYTAGRY